MNPSPEKKIFFASDLHLGLPTIEKSREREKTFCHWLRSIKDNTAELYLVGDIFDFWFEYRKVVPKGFLHILAELSRFREANIPITFLTGNHDMWMEDYFKNELDIAIYKDPITRIWSNKKFYIAHGDGLGPGDHRYKILKKFFRHPICQWAFRWLHPDIGMAWAEFWSKKSRGSNFTREKLFLGADKEWLYIFAQEMLDRQHYDYFIFGHRHLPLNLGLKRGSQYINLGDWIKFYTYAEFDGYKMELRNFIP